MFFSSDGMLTLMQGFDKAYKASFKRRSIFHKRGIALLLTLLLGVLLLLSIVLLMMGEDFFGLVSNVVHNDRITTILYAVMRWLTAFALLYIGVNIIYYFGPSLRKSLPFVNPGSIVASLLSLLSSLVFAYFVNSFGQYNQLYGSIGALGDFHAGQSRLTSIDLPFVAVGLSVMMLVGGGLRVALATTHLPLKDVSAAVTQIGRAHV